MYKRFGKRFFDLFISFFVLIIFSPILVLLIILIFFALGRPVFFIQSRPGLNGKLFKMIKFRTMTNEKDKNGQILSDEVRITRFGNFLRKSSLDELPEIINVLKGNMSFIGPRPLLVEYLGLYNDYQNRRHEVKPGITGWAQVNGRNAISWQKKFELDVWYVDNISFWLDIRILFLTLKKVIISEGISSDTSVTMEKFKGNS